MKFSEHWLRDLVDIRVDRVALVRGLNMAGHEVESLTQLGDGLDGVVVVQILSAEKHPQADRLRVCKVDAGRGGALSIVCGAPNAGAGLKAPLAMVGAKLPGGVEIKAAQLRGVESQGMLCSAKELGIDADASGLLELPGDAPVGLPLADYLGFPDASIELGLTPNRSDCLGMLGLAHDVAAIFDGKLKPQPQHQVAATGQAMRGIRLDAGADCPRYLGRIVEGIDPAARTPLWMAERLRRAGLKTIGAVVDVTNYVMLETGQPLHAFDNDRLAGDIVVRRARAGETLKCLDGNDAKLDPEFLLIADDKRPLAMAGVMGGFDSRVTDVTRNIFLEAAHFAPAAIMGRARKLGLTTDAAHRFERGVDPELPRFAIERATALLIEIAGGNPGGVVEAVSPQHLPQRAPVRLRRARIARVLGIAVPDSRVERILSALDMRVERDADGWRATPPSRRFDIEREEDLIEEVARIHGYDKIPARLPAGEPPALRNDETTQDIDVLGTQLAARGYHEAICYAFTDARLLRDWQIDANAVSLANPLSAELAVMRTSLLPGLVGALRANRHRQQQRVRLFEIGKVFRRGELARHAPEHAGMTASKQPPPEGQAPIEIPRIAAVACGHAHAEQWAESSRALDFFDLKGDLESLLAMTAASQAWSFDADGLPPWLHPGRAARVLHRGRAIGAIGALHPRLLKALDLAEDVHAFELDIDALRERALPRVHELPRFPSVRRDLALDVPETVTWSRIEACVRATLGAILADTFVFDVYSGPGLTSGRKSVAIGLILQGASRTLVDGDVDRQVAAAVAALERELGAKLRS